MAATSLEAIRRITIEARERGLADVAAKLDNIAKAQEGVVASSTSVEKSSGSVEQAFKRTERSLDANIVAYNKYASAVKAVSDAQAQGLVTQQRSAELISLAETRLQKATGTMQQFGKATTGPAQHELINLSRQLQDVGVGLAGGQGLFTIIAQQGPQIADVIATSKASLGDFVSTTVAGVGRFLAAWAPAIGVVTAVGSAAAAAMHTLAQEREARIATTSGQGRLSGIAAGQIPELTESGRTPGMTLGDAREGVLEFVKAGGSAKTTLEAMALATRLAATTGTSLGDAYKMLAGVIRDPVAAAKQLDDQFKIIDQDGQRNIATMQALGDRTGAATQVFQALSGALASQKDSTDTLGGAVAELVTKYQQLVDLMGRAVLLRQKEGQGALTPQLPTGTGRTPDFAGGFLGGDKPAVDRTGAQQSAQAVQATTVAVAAYEAAVVTATRASNDMLSAVADSARAFELQKSVMMATTVEARAAATEAQTLNQLTQGQAATLAQEAQARQAGNAVRAQSVAGQTQLIAAQKQELDMGNMLVVAAGVQGAAGVALRAGLQEEMAIRQAGLSVTSQDSQERIANAEAIALQKTEIQDVSQAAQLTQSIQGQIQMIQLETQMIGANAAERTKAISLLQSELQARQLEAQGFEKAAAAVREYAEALAKAKANQVQAQQAHAQATATSGGGGIGSSQQYETDYHNAQAQALREIDMLQAQMDSLGMSAGAAAQHIKEQEIENQALATTSQGTADALRDSKEALASMTGALADAREAEQRRQQTLQESVQAENAYRQALEQTQEFKNRSRFAAGGDQPLSERGGFESTRMPSWQEFVAIRDAAEVRSASSLARIPDIQKQAQQKQLSVASSAIGDQIQALQDQRSSIEDNTNALQDNISALEKETTKRREQLDKQIAKLEKALDPTRPDPYAERNPDYFYRFGTQAFKENDPTQALLSAAEAERDGLDNQLDAMKEQLEQQKKAVELQQKAIDEQIKGYEAQSRELDRAANLLSAGVDLSAQEVAGIKAVVAAIQGLGDYARLQAANTNQMTTDIAKANQEAYAAAMSGVHTTNTGLAVPGMVVPTGATATNPGGTGAYGFQKGISGFSGFFASGGYIPPGSWGIAGESGPEVISRKRAIAGPATVTPIGGGRPIVVNQTFVSQGGARELRASRGEIAQRSSSEMRRSLGAR